MTKDLALSLDLETIEKLGKAGFLRPSLEPYLVYHKTFKEELEKNGGRIEDALVSTSEICKADYSTIRRAINKVSVLFSL